MKDVILQGRRIAVVEDDFFLASELCLVLEDAGATIVGPVATVPAALDLLAAEPLVEGAMLDVNLRGQMVFPVADMLVRQNVPFVFTTGYDGSVLAPRFGGVPRLEKPIDPRDAVRAIAGLIASRE